jgi:hypothetical protein
MISFTFVTALGVSEIGGVFFASGVTSGTVVVAIALLLGTLNYSKLDAKSPSFLSPGSEPLRD